MLITNRISSAPVYDATSHTYIGMFDYTDLLTYVLLVLKRARISEQENTKEVLRLVQQAAAEQAVPVRLASGKHLPLIIFSIHAFIYSYINNE